MNSSAAHSTALLLAWRRRCLMTSAVLPLLLCTLYAVLSTVGVLADHHTAAMELGGPSSPSGMERLASGELASAFSGLTTTSTQLGQGQAPGGFSTLPKRQLPLQPQQGGGLLPEHALVLPWAKRR